jgi:hypothetical protein
MYFDGSAILTVFRTVAFLLCLEIDMTADEPKDQISKLRHSWRKWWCWRSWMRRRTDILTSQKLNYLGTPAVVRPFSANGMKGHARIKTRNGRGRRTCSEE